MDKTWSTSPQVPRYTLLSLVAESFSAQRTARDGPAPIPPVQVKEFGQCERLASPNEQLQQKKVKQLLSKSQFQL